MFDENKQKHSTNNENIKSKVVKSAKWTTFQSVVNMAYGPLYKILMAMIISPEGFAYISAILVVMNIGDLLTTIGFSQALIVEKNSDSRQFSTVFWIDVITAVIMSVIIAFGSSWIEWFYQLAGLTEMIVLVSVCVLISGMSRTFRCYLQKELRHDTVVKNDILKMVLDSTFSLVCIILTKSMIGYVLGTLISRFISLLCFVYSAYRCGYRMGFYFDVEFLKKIKSFSASVTVRNIMAYVVSIVDELIIARLFVDKSVLGMYFFAKDLIAKPQGVITSAVSQVALSTLAKFSDNLKKVADLFLKMSKYLATAAFPVFLGLALTSTEFLPALFGREYADATVYVCCFCVNSVFLTITNSPGSAVLYTVRKASTLLFIDVINSVIYLLLMGILGRYGVIYIVLAKMISMLFSVVATNATVMNSLSLSLIEYLKNIKIQIIATSFLALGVIIVKFFIPESLTVWVELIASVATGAVLYIAIILKNEKNLIRETFSMIKRR